MNVLAFLLIASGIVILAISTLALITLPGFFNRAHAVAKSETLGILLTLVGLVVYHRGGPGSLALLVVLVIALIANPTAVHALARAAASQAPHTRSDPSADPSQEPS